MEGEVLIQSAFQFVTSTSIFPLWFKRKGKLSKCIFQWQSVDWFLCANTLYFNFSYIRNKICGPVAALLRFKTEEEAVCIANDTDEGSFYIPP